MEHCNICNDGKTLAPGWKCDICGRIGCAHSFGGRVTIVDKNFGVLFGSYRRCTICGAHEKEDYAKR